MRLNYPDVVNPIHLYICAQIIFKYHMHESRASPVSVEWILDLLFRELYK